MAYLFFYISIITIDILFLIIIKIKNFNLAYLTIGFTTIGISLINDIIFGDQLHLYFYIRPGISTLYMVLAAVFLYPILNIIYLIFLPERMKLILYYSAIWILAMLIFEFSSVKAKTIVFTGWKPLPWSIVVYVFTYCWINFYYRALKNK